MTDLRDDEDLKRLLAVPAGQPVAAEQVLADLNARRARRRRRSVGVRCGLAVGVAGLIVLGWSSLPERTDTGSTTAPRSAGSDEEVESACTIPPSQAQRRDVGRTAAEACFGGPLPAVTAVPPGWSLTAHHVEAIGPASTIRIDQVFTRDDLEQTDRAFISLQTVVEPIEDLLGDLGVALGEEGYLPDGAYWHRQVGDRTTLVWGSDELTFRIVAANVPIEELLRMARSVSVP